MDEVYKCITSESETTILNLKRNTSHWLEKLGVQLTCSQLGRIVVKIIMEPLSGSFFVIQGKEIEIIALS